MYCHDNHRTSAMLLFGVSVKILNCVMYNSQSVFHNSRLTAPVFQLFLSMSIFAHISILTVWVIPTVGLLTSSSIREYSASDKYTSSSVPHNHFLYNSGTTDNCYVISSQNSNKSSTHYARVTHVLIVNLYVILVTACPKWFDSIHI